MLCIEEYAGFSVCMCSCVFMYVCLCLHGYKCVFACMCVNVCATAWGSTSLGVCMFGPEDNLQTLRFCRPCLPGQGLLANLV